MAPIRTYSNWNERSSDSNEQLTPYRHYYFLCEGRNTEKWYFEKIIDIRKDLSINSMIDMIYLEKKQEPMKIYLILKSLLNLQQSKKIMMILSSMMSSIK